MRPLCRGRVALQAAILLLGIVTVTAQTTLPLKAARSDSGGDQGDTRNWRQAFIAPVWGRETKVTGCA